MSTTAAAAPAPPASNSAHAPAAKPPVPTEFPPAVKATIGWLNERFCWWYKHNPPPVPDRFTRREFGYIPWPDRPGPPPFVRHLGFDSATHFQESLARSGPHSVYYSTAYYRRPTEMKMLDKQWLGAELIFDLDADHLADVEAAKARGEEVPLAEQLRQVKVMFKKLLDRFLFGHFGLSDKDVWITFSGGRGYHAHVVEERLLQLGSKERREIVDYITGKFPTKKGSEEYDLEFMYQRVPVHATKFGEHTKARYRLDIPPPTTPGWPGDLTSETLQLLEQNVLGADSRTAKKWLMKFPNVGEKKAEEFLRVFTKDKLEQVIAGRSSGDVNAWRLGTSGREFEGTLADPSGVLARIFETCAKEQAMPMAKGETDEPVTADVKRLIRLPGSLHGKSGLKVVTLTRDSLDGFDPLRDAVAFGMDPVPFTPRKDQEATLGGQRVVVKAGEQTAVPEAHAVFWCARQAGTVRLPPKTA